MSLRGWNQVKIKLEVYDFNPNKITYNNVKILGKFLVLNIFRYQDFKLFKFSYIELNYN